MHDDPYIPRSWGGGCTAAALYKQFRERGMSKFEAACQLLYVIRAADVITDPPLPPPVEIIPHADTDNISVVTAKPTKAGATLITLDGVDVRITPKRSEIELPKAPGRREQWDWNEARIFGRNLHLRAVAMGEPEPDIVAEVRLFFRKKHGCDENGNDIVPSNSSIYEHVQAWRTAGDYT